MATATLTCTLSCNPDDGGGTRSLVSSGVLDVDSASEGNYTATTTYFKMFGSAVAAPQCVLIYNTGSVDLAVRLNMSSGTRYVSMACPPGGILVVPEKITSSTIINAVWTDLSVRCSSGTCSFDYCILR